MDFHDDDPLNAAENNSPRERSGTEWLTVPGQAYFGVVGSRMRKLGWAVLPQNRGERGVPQVVGKWRQYQKVPPSQELTDRWTAAAADANAAILMGAVSGNTICLDLDITDFDLSLHIQEIAEEILGLTPFRRVGRRPKMALFYRMESGALAPNRTYYLMDEEGKEKTDHIIELQSHGKLMTAYGPHHETGTMFTWQNYLPWHFGPEHAPLISEKNLQDFLDRVEEVRPFHRNSFSNMPSDWEYIETDGIHVPRLQAFGGDTGWAEDTEGYVYDGREKFLWSLATNAARANPGACADERGVDKLKRVVFDEFRKKARLDGKWSEGFILEQVAEKVRRACHGVASGQVKPRRARSPAHTALTPEMAKKYSQPIKREARKVSDPLGYLPQFRERGDTARKLPGGIHFTPVSEEARAERALISDRTEIAKEVQNGLNRALNSFWGEVYDGRPEEIKPIHVLKAPTGAGKTSRSIQFIAEDERTKLWDEALARGEDSPGPIVFLLPTYNNIDELKKRAEILNLDASLDNEGLAAQAKERGLVSEEELEASLADLRRNAMNAGLKTMVYRGKVAAGCLVADKVQMLMSAGIGTSGLCKAKVTKKGEEPEEVVCKHYSTCPAIRQRSEIRNSHVVFTPHAFLTNSIPEELKKARAVVADERVFPLFVHTTTFHLDSLQRQRKEPRLTKKEKEQGLHPQQLLNERNEAADFVIDAFHDPAKPCPVNFLATKVIKRGNGELRSGRDLVKSAIRVCGNAISADANINPDMSDIEIADLCAKPTGTEVREEYRMWKIIEERLDMLIPDRVLDGLDRDNRFDMPRRATGDREMRIQFLLDEDGKLEGHKTEMIRLSWRTEPNWKEAPILLLDASASPEITSKLFGQREVVVHNIDAPLNVRTVAVADRTYSNASIVAKGGSRKQKLSAAKVKDSLQRLLSFTSSMYGYGRVVAGANVAIRRSLNTDWVCPSNVDFCHYGATRGLDFAKYHAAAISFGRMEVPVRTIDGIVAALTYDDETPEKPFDVRGDGSGDEGGPLLVPAAPAPIKLRNGQDGAIQVPTYPGRWAKIVQQQYREEELRQFVGRLRPVYREGEAPVWIAASNIIPDGIIIDEIVCLQDLTMSGKRSDRLWDAVRKCDGVLHADLADACLPGAKMSIEGWRKELEDRGFDSSTGILEASNRYAWGFTPVQIERGNGEITHVFVRTDIRDMETAIVEAFRRYLGESVVVEAFLQAVAERQPGLVREPDWVQEELGTVDQRRMAEESTFSEAVTYLFQRVPSPDFIKNNASYGAWPPRVVLSSDDKGTIQLDAYEFAAFLSTDAMWDRVREGHSSKVSSPVMNPTATLEHDRTEMMGATDMDAVTYEDYNLVPPMPALDAHRV